MKPTTAGALVLLFLLGPALAAIAAETAPIAAPTTAGTRPFEIGDQTIGLAVGANIPLFTFGGDSTTLVPHFYTGGSFSFTYQYFVASGLAVGGTLAGSFNGTWGGLSLFIAPLSARVAYWWNLDPFEINLAFEAGAYLSRLNGKGMIGPFLKLGGGASWRVANAWSIGIQPSYWFVPELHAEPYANLTRFGNFLETALTATYHL